jgi:hypothetical protein
MPVSIGSFLERSQADLQVALRSAQGGDAAQAFDRMANAIACLSECVKLLDARTAVVESEHPAPPPAPLG